VIFQMFHTRSALQAIWNSSEYSQCKSTIQTRENTYGQNVQPNNKFIITITTQFDGNQIRFNFLLIFPQKNHFFRRMRIPWKIENFDFEFIGAAQTLLASTSTTEWWRLSNCGEMDGIGRWTTRIGGIKHEIEWRRCRSTEEWPGSWPQWTFWLFSTLRFYMCPKNVRSRSKHVCLIGEKCYQFFVQFFIE